jgi:serine/threonine protein phosphatase PrpC
MPSVETVWIQGQGPCNEDRLILDPARGLYGVADGATGLDRFRDENGLTGGAIAAETVAEHFRNLGPEKDLIQATLEANERLRQVMREHGMDLQKTETLWAAAHAVVRFGEHHIEWVQSGDCMIYALYRDQTVRTVTRDSVEAHDRQVIELWKQRHFSRTDGKLPEGVREKIRLNRRMANRSGGYSCINGDPALAHHLESGRLARSNLAALLLMSDGFYYGFGDILSAEDLVLAIAQEGLNAYAERLCRFENAEDPDCLRIPRLKRSDDKAGILIRF